MAKSSKWGNIVFYKTKDGQLRWFDPNKAKTPEGKAKIKAIRSGTKISNKSGKITEMNEDRIKKAKENADVNKKRKENIKAYNNYGNAVKTQMDTKKAIESGAGQKEINKKSNAERQAKNEYLRDQYGPISTPRDILNEERAQKKAQERAHANEVYKNASSNKDEAKKYAKYLEVNKDGNIQAKGNDTKAYFNKIQGEKLNQKSAEAQAKKDKARARIEKMKADNKAMQEEIKKAHQETKLTNATGERKQKALDSLKRIKGSEDYRNSKKADAEQEKAMIKHARVMDDAHSTNKEMNDASRALRTANNEAVRHGANPKGFSTTQGRDSRDELNIERARKKAETRNHTNQIREIMNKEENGGLGGVMFPRNKEGDKNASFYEKYGDAVRPNPRKLDEYNKYQKGNALNYISDGIQKTRVKQNDKLSNATGERKTKALEALKKKKEHIQSQAEDKTRDDFYNTKGKSENQKRADYNNFARENEYAEGEAPRDKLNIEKAKNKAQARTKQVASDALKTDTPKEASSLKWSKSPYGFKQAKYKGYSIEDGLYKGKVSVSMGGEDVIFSSVKEAQAEIDKMSKPRKKRSAKSALK